MAWGTSTVLAETRQRIAALESDGDRTCPAVGRRHRRRSRAARARALPTWRYCSLISTKPADDQQRRPDARGAQRLLQHDDGDAGAEQHAGLAQGGDDGDRRQRHRPQRDAVGQRLQARRRRARAARSAASPARPCRRRATAHKAPAAARCRRTARAHRLCGLREARAPTPSTTE